nr:hypothetical protein [Fodinicola feengrottensis]
MLLVQPNGARAGFADGEPDLVQHRFLQAAAPRHGHGDEARGAYVRSGRRDLQPYRCHQSFSTVSRPGRA